MSGYNSIESEHQEDPTAKTWQKPQRGPKDTRRYDLGHEFPLWLQRWRLLATLKMEDFPESKGERCLLQSAKPNVAGELPAHLRAEDILHFNTAAYDIRNEAMLLLDDAGPRLGFGTFEANNRELEYFNAKQAVFCSFNYEKKWRMCMLEREDFLAAYERLVVEVVCPHLRAKENSEQPMTFYYQYPPTLRLQPGRGEKRRRLHRDAEFGHQDGEINCWMPLTDYSKTETTLYLETQPNASDFHPFEITYGSIGIFNGTNVRHYVPPNPTDFTRISMDFRIGIDKYYDPHWTLEGIDHVHQRRTCIL